MSSDYKNNLNATFDKKLEDKMSGKRTKQDNELLAEELRHRKKQEEIMKKKHPGITID